VRDAEAEAEADPPWCSDVRDADADTYPPLLRDVRDADAGPNVPGEDEEPLPYGNVGICCRDTCDALREDDGRELCDIAADGPKETRDAFREVDVMGRDVRDAFLDAAAERFTETRDAEADRIASIFFSPSRTLWVQYGHASECFVSHSSTHTWWKMCSHGSWRSSSTLYMMRATSRGGRKFSWHTPHVARCEGRTRAVNGSREASISLGTTASPSITLCPSSDTGSSGSGT